MSFEDEVPTRADIQAAIGNLSKIPAIQAVENLLNNLQVSDEIKKIILSDIDSYFPQLVSDLKNSIRHN